MDDLLFSASGRELAEQIKKKKISSSELVDFHIRYLRKINPVINAIAVPLFESAIDCAKKADELLARRDPSDLPDFFGVPCSIKASYSIKNQIWFGGSHYRTQIVANSNAYGVEKYIGAGLIPICTSNMSEGGMWMDAENSVVGRTNNPHDITRSPGGSSGGEGSLIAAGATPLGLGSDTGGSIRYPAAFCGVSGHKPTGGIIPLTGSWPTTHGSIEYLTCSGPMARRASDLFPLFNLLLGGAKHLLASECSHIESTNQISFKNRTIYYYSEDGRYKTDNDIKACVDFAVMRAGSLGFKLEKWRPPFIEEGFEIFTTILQNAPEAVTGEELLANGNSVNPIIELLKSIIGANIHTVPTSLMILLEKLIKHPEKTIKRYLEQAEQMKLEVNAKLSGGNLIISPVYPSKAVKHKMDIYCPYKVGNTSCYNFLGLPASVVPVLWDKDQLPLSVQIIGSKGMDYLTMALAEKLEDFKIPPFRNLLIQAKCKKEVPLVSGQLVGKKTSTTSPRAICPPSAT
ncbi:MAG: hypothetical protein HOE90_02680 [Bacteriovoracaceae bacterium]|jgi:fatty acid amide hydrolase 2|nr:hypothetical protein [Bacteriovoracaceae bacterium]